MVRWVQTMLAGKGLAAKQLLHMAVHPGSCLREVEWQVFGSQVLLEPLVQLGGV
jgi:hypothetical protein